MGAHSNAVAASNRPRITQNSRAIDRGSIGWSLDGRSREGRFLTAYSDMLAEHCGGNPSRVQKELIRRCARLALHLELQDEKLLAGVTPSDHASRQYLAWNGHLSRTLLKLGLRGASAERAANLQDYAASRASTSPAALADEPVAEEPATPEADGALPDGQHAA
jgi:hypothetical protein